MKWSSRTVGLGSIHATDPRGRSMELRKKLPHVGRLAESINTLGGEPIHPLTCVRDGKSWRLVAGRDRFAALLLLGVKRVPIRIIEKATPQQIAQAEADENSHRRVMTPDEVASVRTAVTDTLRKEGHVPTSQTVTAEVRKIRAAVEGRSPSAVKQAEKRAARGKTSKAEGGGRTADSAAALDPREGGETAPVMSGSAAGGEVSASPAKLSLAPCPIDQLGVAVSPGFVARVALVINTLEKVNSLLQQAQTVLAALKQAEFEGTTYQRLKVEIHTAAANVRYAKPGLVCVYCRDPDGAAGRAGQCNGCGGRGYLREEQRAGVPREMLAKDAKPVVGAPARAKTLHIELEDEQHVVTKLDPDSLPLPLDGDEPAGDTL